MFNSKILFINLFFQLCIFIAATTIALEIRNLIIRNNKLNHFKILFISSISYSPLGIGIAISYFIPSGYMGIRFFLMIIGYIFSLYSLYHNIKDLKANSNL